MCMSVCECPCVCPRVCPVSRKVRCRVRVCRQQAACAGASMQATAAKSPGSCAAAHKSSWARGFAPGAAARLSPVDLESCRPVPPTCESPLGSGRIHPHRPRRSSVHPVPLFQTSLHAPPHRPQQPSCGWAFSPDCDVHSVTHAMSPSQIHASGCDGMTPCGPRPRQDDERGRGVRACEHRIGLGL